MILCTQLIYRGGNLGCKKRVRFCLGDSDLSKGKAKVKKKKRSQTEKQRDPPFLQRLSSGTRWLCINPTQTRIDPSFTHSVPERLNQKLISYFIFLLLKDCESRFGGGSKIPRSPILCNSKYLFYLISLVVRPRGDTAQKHLHGNTDCDYIILGTDEQASRASQLRQNGELFI